MTITNATTVFPNNIIEIVKTRTQFLDSDLVILKRPVRASDPTQTVGLTAASWLPDLSSFELVQLGGNVQSGEPTLQTYTINVTSFVKDMDEENGQAVHSVLAAMLRSMLYRDSTLRVGLSALAVTMNGHTERAKRWGVRTQRFLNNQVDTEFMYLSTLEFWLETETA